MQTTRGCPFPCEFCSVSTYNGATFRFRPVREVARELDALGARILLADDNVMIHANYSRDLFAALEPLGKHWVAQASLATLDRVDNVRTTSAYLRTLADHGIAVWGSFVFGLDDDEERAFDRTVDFCVESKMTMALVAMLTPYPGTRLYERLAREGRLVRDRWWLAQEHDRGGPFFEPKRMTREALRDGWVRAWRRMYSYGSIRRRWDFGVDRSWVQNVAYWPINLMMHELAERKIARGDRAWRKHRSLDVPFGL